MGGVEACIGGVKAWIGGDKASIGGDKGENERGGIRHSFSVTIRVTFMIVSALGWMIKSSSVSCVGLGATGAFFVFGTARLRRTTLRRVRRRSVSESESEDEEEEEEEEGA